ncbi:2418_t:CDS:2 [Ambispora gerdemannii]|uniref:2418_t:CDS:1 n=1 Tax=Ambispora gerdemannii TaxID=144530 RepID=A0A9N9AF38_9GLOM|nr:2418_t:CDS:2 [Ambispora gerdemannii]
MTKKKYGFGSFVGDFFGAILAVPTYGASLVMSPTARGLAGNIIGSANRAEIERLRKEREENDKKVKHNNDEIERLRAIINNPYSTDEEKKNAKRRIAILEDEIKQLKDRSKKIDNDIEDKSKTPSAPGKP